MVVQGQFAEPTICFSDLQACKELSHSFIRQKPSNNMLRQQTLIFMNQKFQFMIFILANDHFLVRLSSVTLTFNLPEQIFQMNNCAKLFWKPWLNLKIKAPDKLNLWPFYHLTFDCHLNHQPIWTNVSNEHLCQIILKSMGRCRSYGSDKLNAGPFYQLIFKCDLDLQPTEQMFQMNNCAKLFWNPCINVEVMARTSSIYDLLSFDLQEWSWPSTYLNKCFKWHQGDQLCQIILKFMQKI